MTHDELVAELTLVLFYLTSWTERDEETPDDVGSYQAWKGADWDAIDALRDADLIWCSNKAKSVTITEEGVACAKKLLEEYGLNDLLKDEARPTFITPKEYEREEDESIPTEASEYPDPSA